MEPKDRLVIVSNRLPITLRRFGDDWRAHPSSGGLVTAMNPILHRSSGVWIGWPGDSSGAGEAKRQDAIDRWGQPGQYVTVDLPPKIAEHFYEGYSNQTLWPLFHSLPSRLVFDQSGWNAYVEANKRFCDVVLKHVQPGDMIWVHDYHLMLLPRLLRDALPDARIGFFLHIPFPTSELFRLLPGRETLLRGFLGADLLGFQTHAYLQHFRSALLRIIGMESRINQVDVGGRAVRLEALPIGIAPEEFRDLLNTSKEAAECLEQYQRQFRGRRILLAVDRLDYTKGIPERLRAYRRLLEMAPELRGEVILLQVAVPSRERVPSYAQLRHEVNELVGEISGQFATPDWTPVVYMQKELSRAHLVALYAVADVGWVTPLRDGMNLVAKEYVVCNRRNGVLVLSELAGAAAEMGEALLVNPFDEEESAKVVARALSLPVEERRERLAALRKRVERNHVFAWGERFVSYLSKAAFSRTQRRSGEPASLDLPAVTSSYRKARNRLLFLDYDGTLTPYVNRAPPTPDLLRLLKGLVAQPGNHVALVSARRRDDLQRWFGGFRALWLAAEHGAMLRPGDSRTWKRLQPAVSDGWKERVLPVLDHFVDRVPGSLVEEKEYSLIWHYWMADPEFGEWLANELVAMLEEMLAETELCAIRGRQFVEIRPPWINEGQVVTELLAACPESDFRLAVGDDRANEDLFEALDREAWTVHVGKGYSQARFSLPNSESVFELLQEFAGAG